MRSKAERRVYIYIHIYNYNRKKENNGVISIYTLNWGNLPTRTGQSGVDSGFFRLAAGLNRGYKKQVGNGPWVRNGGLSVDEPVQSRNLVWASRLKAGIWRCRAGSKQDATDRLAKQVQRGKIGRNRQAGEAGSTWKTGRNRQAGEAGSTWKTGRNRQAGEAGST